MFHTPELHSLLTADMKALIVYDDFTSAVRAKAILQRVASDPKETVRWNVSPWRMDMLKLSITADTALADALDARLIVLALCNARSLPNWLVGWLDRWALLRHIPEAALALLDDGSADALCPSTAPELSRFAGRHGLSFIFDDCGGLQIHSQVFNPARDEQRSSTLKTPETMTNAQVHHTPTRWGINE
jgi:hypothetical protein